MLPSELTLLKKTRDALGLAQLGTASSLNVPALKVAIDELLLRKDLTFFAAFRARGCALLGEGVELLGSNMGGSERAGVQQRIRTLQSSFGGDATTEVDGLLGAMVGIVRALTNDDTSQSATRDYIDRVVDWENSLYRSRAQRFAQTELGSLGPGAKFTVPALQAYLRSRLGSQHEAVIKDLRILGGGFSKITVLIDVDDHSTGLQSLVIRAEPTVKLILHDGAEIENEYWFLKYAHQSGLLVPEPLWLETDARYFGLKFLVTRKAPGRNIGSAINVRESVSNELLLDLVKHLHRIHQTPIDLSNEYVQRCHIKRWAADKTIHDSIRANIAHWREQAESLDLPSSPLLERTLAWLTNNVPDCSEAPSLIHRDYGTHNILIEGDRVSAILDWESATVGDPAEDLSWAINCMKGAVDRRGILDAYQKISGRTISERRLRYFDVTNAMKFAVTCSYALVLLERHPQTPIDACQLGLLFMHHGTGELNRSIELAEAAR